MRPPPRRAPPDPERDAALAARIAGGDDAALDELAAAHADQLARIARKYVRPEFAAEDAEQIGRTGLQRAAERWDPARDPPFPAYCRRWISQAIRRECFQMGNLVGVTARDITLTNRADREPGCYETLTAPQRERVDRCRALRGRRPDSVLAELATGPPRADPRLSSLREALDALPAAALDLLRLAHGLDGVPPVPLKDAAARLGMSPAAAKAALASLHADLKGKIRCD